MQVSPIDITPDPVKYLWTPTAYKIRRIILGLMACLEEGIDVAQFDRRELVNKVEKIGRARVS